MKASSISEFLTIVSFFIHLHDDRDLPVFRYRHEAEVRSNNQKLLGSFFGINPVANRFHQGIKRLSEGDCSFICMIFITRS
jgi:hypothetical protein